MDIQRPFWVGFVCWVLIILFSLALYYELKKMGDALDTEMGIFPYSVVVAKTILFGTGVTFIISGICMYERQGWARFTYLAASIPYLFQRYIVHANIAEKFAKAPPAPGHHNWDNLAFPLIILFYLFSIFILFLPSSRRYFHPPMYVDE